MTELFKQDATQGEFALINSYFKSKTISRPDVILGIGDDAALVKVPDNQLLVLSMDTLVEGVHFPFSTLPSDLGYKALAVNLSDLAAMGATPAWMTLALTMPHANQRWLDEFTRGLFQLATEFNVQLIGGDTTRGPLTVTMQAHGFVLPECALTRHGAHVGDKIYVSGTLGDAGLGLEVALGKRELSDSDEQYVLRRLHRPFPHIQLGLTLKGLANSAIDISDGLLADLNHVLESSHVGAVVHADLLPLSDVMLKLPVQEAQKLALTAGDDYELCFTVSAEHEKALIAKLGELKLKYTCIGEIVETPGLTISGFTDALTSLGYQHF